MKVLPWLTGLFLLFFTLVIILANTGQGTFFAFIYAIPAGDKIGHVVLMGLASFFINLLLQGSRVQLAGQPVMKGSLIVTVVVLAEEISQLFVSTRTFSLVDLGSSYVGIVLFGRLAARLIDQRQSKERMSSS